MGNHFFSGLTDKGRDMGVCLESIVAARIATVTFFERRYPYLHCHPFWALRIIPSRKTRFIKSTL